MTQYDVCQVCLNGHIRNDSIKLHPGASEDYCVQCGEKTITQCPECSVEIRGAQFIVYRSTPQLCESLNTAPAYCLNCGKPYPWTNSKIMTAIQIFAEFGHLDEEDKKTIEQDINNIAKDIPQAELSAMRIKRIWEKCSSAGYEIIMELASRTAANILKGP